ASGVLANDTDAGGSSTLTAAVDVGPSHGTLTWDLNSDGGFQYAPTAGYVGTNTFTYHATDGTASSATVTVTLAITAGSTSGHVIDFGSSSDTADFSHATFDNSAAAGGAWSIYMGGSQDTLTT